MNHVRLKEKAQHGTFSMPAAFYHVTPQHPRYQMPYHWHPEYEIIRVLQGAFEMNLDGESVFLSAGDVLFLHGGVLHGGIPRDCIYECIVLDLERFFAGNPFLPKELSRILNHEYTVFLKLQTTDAIVQSIDALFHTLQDTSSGAVLLFQSALYQLLGTIIVQQQYDTGSSTLHSGHLLQLKEVLRYIDQNYTEPISLDTLAQIAGLNSKYFCHYFRMMTQRTPTDYINYYRIECACQKLASSKEAVIDIAFSCGFNDVSYFIKMFKKYKGLTPKQYAKQL